MVTVVNIISCRYKKKKEKMCFFPLVVRTFRIYSLSNLQIYHIVVLTLVIMLYQKGFLKAKLTNNAPDTATLTLPHSGFSGALCLLEGGGHDAFSEVTIWPQAGTSQVSIQNIATQAGDVYLMVLLFANTTGGPAPLNPIPDTESLQQKLRRTSWENNQWKGSTIPCKKWFCSPLAFTTLYSFPRAVVTKYHELGFINNRNLLPHSSGSQSLRSRHQQSCFLLMAVRSDLFQALPLPSGDLLPVLGIAWPHRTLPSSSRGVFPLCLHTVFPVCMPVSKFPLTVQTRSWWIEAHPGGRNLIIHFYIRSHSQVPGVRTSNISF